MYRYISILRGINVSGQKRIKMAELKSMRLNRLHLEKGKNNEGAIKFYKNVVFHIITEF